MLFVLGSVYGCVRWVGMPELPKGTTNDTALYGASDKLWAANVARARKLVREPEAQHGQSALLAVPEVGSRASSGRVPGSS